MSGKSTAFRVPLPLGLAWFVLAAGFIWAKLAGYSDHSWWVVTFPIWVVPTAILAMMAVACLVVCTIAVFGIVAIIGAFAVVSFCETRDKAREPEPESIDLDAHENYRN